MSMNTPPPDWYDTNQPPPRPRRKIKPPTFTKDEPPPWFFAGCLTVIGIIIFCALILLVSITIGAVKFLV